MRNGMRVLGELTSLMLAVGIWVFFNMYPGYTPTGEYGLLVGIGVVFAIAVVYDALEVAAILRSDTPSPVYFAWETLISYTPLLAFAMVAQRWIDGLIVISPFQWLTAAILLIAILLDVFGFVTLLAQRYLLTDELKSVQ